MKSFKKCLFNHLSRDENHMADALATLSLMCDSLTGMTMKSPVIMKVRAPYYGSEQIMDIQIGPKEKPLFYDVQKFIKERKYLDKATSKEKYAFRVPVCNYASHEGVLYKRMMNGT